MADEVVTVVVPTWNRLVYLQEAVESVRSQTYSRWRLVVVDDASTDGTWEWLQALGDGIRVLRQPGHGERSAARNRGLREAPGQYVLFLDDDDRLAPAAIETLVRAMARRPGAAFAAGARVLFDEGGHVVRVPHPRIGFARHNVWRDVLLGWVSVPGQTMFRTTALREVGGWEERLVVGEDQELLLRVGIAGACVISPTVVLENRVHSGQWRPADTARTEEDFRRDFVRRLTGARRELGERLLLARGFLERASEAYAGQRFLDTARSLARGVRVTPQILWSPLVGPRLLALWLRAVAGMALGGKLFRLARALRRSVRQHVVLTW
jgi:glycosyltransferase involved in cell wall biosynthesis